MKLAAIYHLGPDLDYFQSSLNSVLPSVDAVFVNSQTGAVAQEVQIHVRDGNPKIRWAGTATRDDSGHFQTLVNQLSTQGFTHTLWLESEDVFPPADLARILRFVQERQEAGQFLVQCVHYWKSPFYRIDPPDPELRIFLSRLTPATQCQTFGRTSEAPVVVIPDDVGQLHNFAFAGSAAAVLRRLWSQNIAQPGLKEWEQAVWQGWNNRRGQRNLHPLTPERFRVASPVSPVCLPDALASHPALDWEIVQEIRQTNPVFSLIFRAESSLSVAGKFIDSLAATAPEQLEWIACVPQSRLDLIELLQSRPGGQVVPVDPHNASVPIWDQACRLAQGRILVFAADHLAVAGDWMEGLEAALEGLGEPSIIIPRVQYGGDADRDAASESGSTKGASNPSSIVTTEQPGNTRSPLLTRRQLLFERRRGEFFGRYTLLDGEVALDRECCWACTPKTWRTLSRKVTAGDVVLVQNGRGHDKGSSQVRAYIAEDTLVFSDTPERLEASRAHCSVPEDSSAGGETTGAIADASQTNGHNTCQPGSREFAVRGGPEIPVSIVIPVFNNLNYTRQCLDSIFQHTPAELFELIVIDNGSSDGSREYLESLAPRIRYLRNSRNIFFARGCNRGAWAARGENILFLNNDTVVTPGWLDGMLELLDRRPEVGIVGNKQLFPYSNPVYGGLVWHAGKVFTEEKESWHIYFGFDSDHPAVNVERDYPAVTGCCMLVRRSLFASLGGFDPSYRNGYEDTDLCLRAGRLGVRIAYTPKSAIVHHVSASESRFDHDVANHRRFKSRWAEHIEPSEAESYRAAGLLEPPPQTGSSNVKPLRVGFLTPFNQQSALADYAAQLLSEYPAKSFVVLGDYAVQTRSGRPEPPNLYRCWDPQATWLRPLQRWIQSLDLDILHVNLDSALWSAAFYQTFCWAQKLGKHIVFTLHHTSPPSVMLREFCDLADALIVHSPENRLELILNGCEPSKIHVIPPGVPRHAEDAGKEGSSRSSLALRQKLRLPVFTRIIVTPGFVSRRKGILDAVHAIQSIRQHVAGRYLVLGPPDIHEDGSVEYLEECKRAVRTLKLEQDVVFIDRFLDDGVLSDYLACADAVLLPYQSQKHGWSSAAAAALSLGKPVITSSDPMFNGLGDAVLRTTACLSLAQAVVSVLTHPYLAMQLRQRATAFAEGHTWKLAAERHLDIYRKLQDGSSTQAGSSRFVKYQTLAAGFLLAPLAEKALPVLKQKLTGRTIEFGSRSLELTDALRPQVSVTANTDLAAIAEELQCITPFLTVEQFRQSFHAQQVFETILLHVSEEADSCARLILSLLPHLSSEQRLLVLMDPSSATSRKVIGQFEKQTVAGWVRERTDLDRTLRLVEFRRAAAVPAGVGNATNRSEPALERDRVRICWEGPQLVNHSLALVNRELEGALLESGQVELRILPVGANSFAGSLASKYRQLTRYYSSDNSGPVDVHVRHQWPPNWVPPSSGHFVVIQPWEFGSVPVEWLEGVNEAVDEVWAPSAFVRDLYVQSGLEAVRVHVVPNGVDTEFFKPGLKPFEIHSAKSFRFLFVGGTIHRKGADILLNAYLQSFRSSDDVTLVFKDMGTGNIYQGQGLGERIRQIQEDRGTPHIVYLDRDLSDSDMARLYNACHCLVHPYRGEGFALPVLEAMACGLPVIVTAGGATDDFVTNDTGYKIPSCKQVFGNREISGLKTAGDLWMLEPDSSALAGLLQHVFRHREEARQKGQLGRLEAQRHWTWKEAASRAVERIQALRHQPIRRFQDEADCAVLLNFQKPVSPERLRATLDSLQRNSYANLKIYLRSNETGQSFGSLAGESSALHWVNGETLSSTLRTIDRQVRAPFLALVSEPLEFSKQWFGQIAAVARQANCETVMIAPSINLRNAAHYVEYSEGDDDHSFQKFARSLWRSRRGQVEKLSDPPAGCTVVNWACVRSAVRRSFANADEWLKSLQEEGAPALWAQDTFLRWREH